MQSKFSQDIRYLLERLADQPITLASVLAETAERGFCLVIGLLVLPFLFPMPPGVTTILGSACLLLSLQMALGRTTPWLPARVARFQFPKVLSQQLLHNLKQVTQMIERVTQPRWSKIANNAYIWQVNGLCIAWLTLLLMAPIPFTNPIPTVGILAFVVASLEADGLLLCLSYGFTALTTAGFGLLVFLLWRSPDLFQRLL